MQSVTIIGGGPAGLTAAIKGAKNGLNITLYEKCKVGENIRCAEGFFDTLNLLGQPAYGVKMKIDEIVLRLQSQYDFPTDDRINIWMIDRSQWQKGLADEARALGVNIKENHPVDKESFKVIAAQNTWVIDSTGVPSITSLAGGFHNYYAGTSAIAVQYSLEGDFQDLYGKLKLGLEDHYPGYYWIFPKSRHEANVGLGFHKKNHLNLWTELDRILNKEGLSSYRKIKKLGGLCPISKVDRLVYDNVLLTGDAAGLVSPLHGGGIDTACISGGIAIQCILNNRVNHYEREINTVLGEKLKGEKELFNWWQQLNYTDLEDIIKLMHHANISLGQLGLLNGQFDVLNKIAAMKNTLFSGIGCPNLQRISSFLPTWAVQRLLNFFLK